MKIFLLILFFVSCSYAQDKGISRDNIIKSIEPTLKYSSSDEIRSDLKNPDQSIIEKWKRLILQTQKEDSKEAKIILQGEGREYANDLHGIENRSYYNLIKRKLMWILSDKEYKIIDSDYILRGKISQSRTKKFVDQIGEENMLLFCNVDVVDIIKGDKQIKKTKKCEFFLNDTWFWNRSNTNYNVGGEYILYLRYRPYDDGSQVLSVIPNLDGNEGFFPVVGDRYIEMSLEEHQSVKERSYNQTADKIRKKIQKLLLSEDQ